MQKYLRNPANKQINREMDKKLVKQTNSHENNTSLVAVNLMHSLEGTNCF